MTSSFVKAHNLTLPSSIKNVVLAYSGGLDTSFILKVLASEFNVDVVTLTLDFGQQEYSKENLDAVKKKAIAMGAKKAIVLDVKQEFVADYVSKAIKANCLYQGTYPNSTAIGRPLIAKHLAKIAKEEGAQAIVHGCTGKGNDQVRFEVSIKAIDPSLVVIAPVRDWNLSRDEEYAYAKDNGIPLSTSAASPYSVDANLWGRAVECGDVDHPQKEIPSDAYSWVTLPEKAPDKAAYATLHFEKGMIVAVEEGTKKVKGSLESIQFLNELAGKYGVGGIDSMEDRMVGLKSREFYECPAAVVILSAHKDLEKCVLTREENEFKPVVDKMFAELSYKGLWYAPLMDEINAFVDASQKKVTGWVKVKLYKGSATIAGRDSVYLLYDTNLAAYDKTSAFDQKDAPGFISLWGLNTVLAKKIEKKAKV